MKVITYHIELDEPVLATALAGDPNTGASFGYLPGSVLRGALIAAYMRQKRVEELAASDKTAQRLFLNGQTQYLNGYLLDREGQRALPRPLSWQQEKEAQQRETEDTPASLFDFAYEEQEDDPDKQWKAPKSLFFSFTKKSDKIRWLSPDRVLAVHTQRDPVKGRSTTEQGAVYQYEALAAGQIFAAMIVCHNGADEPFLSDLLEGEHNIGGSRGAGYGRVRFKKVETKMERELLGELETEINGRFLVACLSDLLLQNEEGQFQADPQLAKSALEKQLKCKLLWFGGNQPNAFINGNHIGGFNRKWGLPLPQAKAISMGSVFVFEPPQSATVEQLQALEARGLGLRRAEGFGRIAFNWQTEEKWEAEEWVQSGRPSTITLAPETSEGQLAQTMVNRLFRLQLDAQLAVKANNWATKLPVQNSQLSRLRQVVQDELYKRPSEEDKLAAKTMHNGRERLRNYAKKLKERAATRQQFDRAQINNKPLLDWLENRLKDDASIEAVLQVAATPAIGDTKGQWTAVMRYEYNLRLIDLTLAHCLKKGKEGN
jgi:CRISPR-associated protein Csx10